MRLISKALSSIAKSSAYHAIELTPENEVQYWQAYPNALQNFGSHAKPHTLTLNVPWLVGLPDASLPAFGCMLPSVERLIINASCLQQLFLLNGDFDCHGLRHVSLEWDIRLNEVAFFEFLVVKLQKCACLESIYLRGFPVVNLFVNAHPLIVQAFARLPAVSLRWCIVESEQKAISPTVKCRD